MARLTSNHREADVTTTRTGRRLLTVAAAAAAALVAAPAVRAATLAPQLHAHRHGAALRRVRERLQRHARRHPTPVPTWRFTDAGHQALLPLVVTQNDTVRDPPAQQPRHRRVPGVPAAPERGARRGGDAAAPTRPAPAPVRHAGLRVHGRAAGHVPVRGRADAVRQAAGRDGPRRRPRGAADDGRPGLRRGRHRLRHRGRPRPQRDRPGAERRWPIRPRSTSATSTRSSCW